MQVHPKSLRHVKCSAHVEIERIGTGEFDLIHTRAQFAKIAEMLTDDFANCLVLSRSSVAAVHPGQRTPGALAGGRSAAVHPAQRMADRPDGFLLAMAYW
jgi:hypothetical protein